MLVPPILRQAILDAKPLPAEHGEHFLVYQSSFPDDLARAKGVIANGGLSLMNEA
ncbi:unnamed protein product, partial [Rotaria sp. Silwood1]